MWADHGTNLEKARAMIEKAVSQDPKNAAFLDSLGWVLFKLNLPDQALPHLLQAAELSRQPDATVYDHLGEVYFALKDLEKARECWKKSLDLEANDAIKKKLALPL
jgi:tetratricopeptide (TPR) repeat protein